MQGITRPNTTCGNSEQDKDNAQGDEAQYHGFQNWILCWNLVKKTKQEKAEAAADNHTAKQRFNKNHLNIRNIKGSSELRGDGKQGKYDGSCPEGYAPTNSQFEQLLVELA